MSCNHIEGTIVIAEFSLEYPLELHRKVKKYAVDAGMKEKQVIAQAIREFFERVDVYKRQDQIYVNGGLLFKKAVCRDSRQGVGYKVTE